MSHINYRNEKMVRKLRTRHMPTKEIRPKGGKGTYNRASAKAEINEFLQEYEENSVRQNTDYRDSI